MKKKIVCTVTNDLSLDQRMHRICSSLASNGHEVVLVGRRLPDSISLVNRNYEQIRLHPFFTKGKLFYIEYNIRLFWFLLVNRWDAVCGVDLDTILPCFVVARLKGKPCVYDAHEYFSEVPELQGRPFVKFFWELLASIVIPRLKYAYTVGPILANVLSQRYRIAFHVVRNVPVRSAFLSRKKPDEDDCFRLIYQGALNEGRGLETAIKAVARMHGVQLHLFGEGDLSMELRALAKQLGAADKVIFHGKVLPDVLRKETPRAHAGLNLLERKGLNYFYSLANKAFDYVQAGLPAICMDFPEYRALNQQYGIFLLLENLTVENLVKAIDDLRNHRNYYDTLRQNCLKAAEELNWEKEEEKLLQFWRSVFNS